MDDGKNINGQQAQPWKNTSFAFSEKPVTNDDNAELFGKIRDMLVQAVDVLRSDAGDDRYAHIVDLIMLRARAIISEALVDNNETVTTAVENAITEYISDCMVQRTEGVRRDIGDFNGLANTVSAALTGVFDEASEEITAGQGEGVADKTEIRPESAQTEIKVTSDEKPLDIKAGNMAALPATAPKKRETADADEETDQLNQILDKINNKVLASVVLLNKNILLRKSVKNAVRVDSVIKRVNVVNQNASVPGAALTTVSSDTPVPEQKQRGKTRKQRAKYAILDPVQLMAVNAFSDKFAAISEYTSGKIDVLNQINRDLLKRVKKIVKLLKPKSFFERLFEYLMEKFKKTLLKKFLKRMFPGKFNIFGLLRKYTNLFDALDAFKKRITTLFKRIYKISMKIVNRIRKIIQFLFGKVIKLVKGVLSGIFKSIKMLLKGFWTAIKLLLKGIWVLLKVIGKFLSKIGKIIFDKVKQMLKNKLSSFLKGLKDMFKGLAKKLGNIFKGFKNFLSNAKNGVKQVFGKFKNALKGVKDKAVKALKSIANKAKQFFKSIAQKAKNFIIKMAKAAGKKLVGFFKKIAVKIFKKIGQAAAKKAAKKAGMKIGIKILTKWFKKFLTKFIIKLGTKLAASLAVNAIPILGQIISAVMLIYTIVDTILTINEVIQLFKENPGLWDVLKEKVAEWVDKAMDFMKGILEAGARLFKALFIDGPKNAGHALGDALFSSNKVCNQLKEAQLNELYKIELTAMRNNRKISALDMANFTIENIDQNIDKMKKLVARAIDCVTRIEKENDAWWRDMDLISNVMKERHPIMIELINLLNKFGLYLSPDYYDAATLSGLESRMKRLKIQAQAAIDAEKERLDRIRLQGCSINFEKLAEFMHEKKNQTDEYEKTLADLKALLKEKYKENKMRLTGMSEDQFEDEEIDLDSGEDEENQESDGGADAA